MSSSAAASARAHTASSAVSHGRISPELVLVDPELARAIRSGFHRGGEPGTSRDSLERSPLRPLVDISTLRRAAAARPVDEDIHVVPRASSKRIMATARPRLVPVVLLVSLFGNGLVLSQLVTRHNLQKTQAAGITTVASAAVENVGAAMLHPTTKADVERAVLSLLLRSPRGNLPPQFIDQTTGLPKNNVRARCRRATRSRSFRCIVQTETAPPGEGVYVRYWPNRSGRTAFSWYGFRQR